MLGPADCRSTLPQVETLIPMEQADGGNGKAILDSVPTNRSEALQNGSSDIHHSTHARQQATTFLASRRRDTVHPEPRRPSHNVHIGMGKTIRATGDRRPHHRKGSCRRLAGEAFVLAETLEIYPASASDPMRFLVHWHGNFSGNA